MQTTCDEGQWFAIHNKERKRRGGGEGGSKAKKNEGRVVVDARWTKGKRWKAVGMAVDAGQERKDNDNGGAVKP